MRIFSFNFSESTHHTTLAGKTAAGLAAPKKNDHDRRAYHREIPVVRDAEAGFSLNTNASSDR
jgi:hypothetical protein